MSKRSKVKNFFSLNHGIKLFTDYSEFRKIELIGFRADRKYYELSKQVEQLLQNATADN